MSTMIRITLKKDAGGYVRTYRGNISMYTEGPFGRGLRQATVTRLLLMVEGPSFGPLVKSADLFIMDDDIESIEAVAG